MTVKPLSKSVDLSVKHLLSLGSLFGIMFHVLPAVFRPRGVRAGVRAGVRRGVRAGVRAVLSKY